MTATADEGTCLYIHYADYFSAHVLTLNKERRNAFKTEEGGGRAHRPKDFQNQIFEKVELQEDREAFLVNLSIF